ncbi:uncharacterized protein LOC123896039 [Trifolium pratense]|uniref:uncharacterized protein LOC123896039 n=1 Tax=Trifolium pratense TaxID=57577 RepID=UPI001E697E04|nr:uncharacterized protein LOC123896039 [Trifolium pratense]
MKRKNIDHDDVVVFGVRLSLGGCGGSCHLQDDVFTKNIINNSVTNDDVEDGVVFAKNIINNSVTNDDVEDAVVFTKNIINNSVCLCLSLAAADSASCRFPFHCETSDGETHLAKKRKLSLQGTKKNNVGNAATVIVHVPVPVARRPRNWNCSTGLELFDDPWKIKKVLKQTDLGSNCNILIKRELAKDFIVPVLGGRQICENRDVRVPVWDLDTNSVHSLVFTIRPSNQSHVFKDTWIRDFVLRRNLKIGDEIGLLWDQYNGQFVFSVLRAYCCHQVRGDQH